MNAVMVDEVFDGSCRAGLPGRGDSRHQSPGITWVQWHGTWRLQLQLRSEVCQGHAQTIARQVSCIQRVIICAKIYCAIQLTYNVYCSQCLLIPIEDLVVRLLVGHGP